MKRNVTVTLQQEAMLRFIICGYKQVHAAEAAGYSRRTAKACSSAMLRKPHVKRRLDELRIVVEAALDTVPVVGRPHAASGRRCRHS
jgi:DNA-binding NarL/FixJ family response regulator